MNILFCAKAPDATKYYRVDIPAKNLVREGHEVRIAYSERLPQFGKVEPVNSKDLEWADVLIFQRPVTLPAMKIMAHAKKLYPGKPVIADYDDNYYQVPRWNPGYPHLKTNEETWQGMVGAVDGIIASTDPLGDELKPKMKKGGELAVIQNGFDFDTFDQAQPWPQVEFVAPDPKQSQKLVAQYKIDLDQFKLLAKDRTVVMWAGSKFHFCDLEWLTKSVKHLCEKRDDILFLFVSYVQGNIVASSKINQLYLTKGVPGCENFYRFLQSIPIDISLAPLHPCEFNASKSNLKLMEAMAIGAYPLMSDWEPYEADLLNEGQYVYGDLVGYDDDLAWATAIESTIDKLSDREFVSQYKNTNDAYVRCNHDAELRVQQYVDYFSHMIDRCKRGAAKK